jgi:hypothetical protein
LATASSAAAGHGGLKAGHLRQHQFRREQEVAAVPEKALGDVAQSRLGIGLLDECSDLLHRADALAALPDIAVIGLGLRRRNAEGHDATLLNGVEAVATARQEFLRADHKMVRRQRQYGLGAEVARVDSGGGHGRTGIAARWLDQNVDFHADLAGLLLGHETIGIVGRDHRPAKQAAIGDAHQGLLKGRLLAQKRHELLGHALARQRPQALAGASDQDDGRDLRHGDCFRFFVGVSAGRSIGRPRPHVGPRYSRR